MELVEEKTLRELLSHGALRMAGSLADLSNLARDESNFELAHSLYRESMNMFRELDHKRGIARLLDCLACLVAAQSAYERSLKLAGAAAALRETLGVSLSPGEQTKLEAKLEPARRSMTNAEGTAIWLEGWALPLEKATLKRYVDGSYVRSNTSYFPFVIGHFSFGNSPAWPVVVAAE